MGGKIRRGRSNPTGQGQATQPSHSTLGDPEVPIGACGGARHAPCGHGAGILEARKGGKCRLLRRRVRTRTDSAAEIRRRRIRRREWWGDGCMWWGWVCDRLACFLWSGRRCGLVGRGNDLERRNPPSNCSACERKNESLSGPRTRAWASRRRGVCVHIIPAWTSFLHWLYFVVVVIDRPFTLSNPTLTPPPPPLPLAVLPGKRLEDKRLDRRQPRPVRGPRRLRRRDRRKGHLGWISR